MGKEIIRVEARPLARTEPSEAPANILAAGGNARFAYNEFFSHEDNDHTNRAYRHAVHRFLAHCESLGVPLPQIQADLLKDYIKGLRNEVNGKEASKPTKKLHLAGIRKFFDNLVVRHAVALNPALSVRGPKHKVREGKTPAMSTEDARKLLASIDVTDVVGLRDRAIIATLIYTAARVGAVAKLSHRDYYRDGRQHCLQLDEKGGVVREIPVRHDLEGFIDEYIAAAGTAEVSSPLFRSAVRKTKRLADAGMTANDILRMVKRRFAAAGLEATRLTCHSFRATTITNLLEQGVPLDDVQYLAGHSDPRTTRLYDRRTRAVTRNVVERITI